MDRNRAIIEFRIPERKYAADLDIPLDITAQDLIEGLNSAFGLRMDTENIRECFLTSEYPIALLKGQKTLKEYGIRNGSIIYGNQI